MQKVCKMTELQPAEVARKVYCVDLDYGTTLEDVLEPKYWRAVTNHLQRGTRIEVSAVDGTVYADLIVYDLGLVYSRVFSEADQEYADEYHLMEIDPDLLALLVERFQIFLRWRAAFDGRAAPPNTHPALPNDKARHEVLKAAIGDRDRLVVEKSKLMCPRFKRFAEFEFEVMWEPLREQSG